MVHLLPLPGSPGARPMDEVLARATSDAALLVAAGFDGLVVENFGDVPFFKDAVPPVTVAALTRAVAVVLEATDRAVPVAVNVLRNDARAALGIAAATGASAIRVNVHAGARVTDQGVIEGDAANTLRARSAWGADRVAVWADVAVKHSTPLGVPRPVAEEALELVERGGADAVIVSGAATGTAVDASALADVAAAVGRARVLVGSGVSETTVAAILEVAAGAIVGTSVKQGGVTTAPVDPARARALVAAAG